MNLKLSWLTELVLLLWHTESFKIEYNGDGPLTVPVNIDEKHHFHLLIDLYRPYSFVFSKKCAGNGTCSHSSHENYIDLKEYRKKGKIIPAVGFHDTHGIGHDFYGSLINITAHSGELVDNLHLGVVEEGNSSLDFEYDGVLGLGLTNVKKVSLAFNTMERMEENVVVFRQLSYKGLKNANGEPAKLSRGEIHFGERKVQNCSSRVAYSPTVSRRKWSIIADIKFNNKCHLNQRISFLPSHTTKISAQHFANYFSATHFNSTNFLPNITLMLQEREFTITPADYTQYFEGQLDPYKVSIGMVDNEDHDFAVGVEFLRKYCLFLEIDDCMIDARIGLSENNGVGRFFEHLWVLTLVKMILLFLVLF
ncbi:unnamed protein product [Bursaphelenchus xylophilus]|uniref:(pine wood nematode) hypothetical protein n=1 Tax=Bursaphelenchus xylophilus TaxID=6326 RepID=A0A1I7SDL8_BURXY|nr:unnamed protein product [Bursaphelenchus xylophilus]CAG9120856.1 unnamed protein product [Bursaphelenchus xylophilus]